MEEISTDVEELQQEVIKLRGLLEEQDQISKMLVRRDLELSEANEQLRHFDRSKSEFVSIAAHQLRTPLSAIRWTYEMLINGDVGELSTAQKTIMMKGYESVRRMIQLINDLLDIDHIESDKDTYEFSEVYPADIIMNVLAEVQSIAEKADVAVEFTGKDTRVSAIAADPHKFRAVIQNLLENAIKYSSGAENPLVCIDLKEDGNDVVISISDNGIGIPLEEQKQLFTKFFRGVQAVKRSPDGSGLGLFFVKTVVEKHDGSISFESEEGKGATFFIRIPKLRPAQNDQEESNGAAS